MFFDSKLPPEIHIAPAAETRVPHSLTGAEAIAAIVQIYDVTEVYANSSTDPFFANL